jgi:secondary thiamine-phosphate synthase enzyme
MRAFSTSSIAPVRTHQAGCKAITGGVFDFVDITDDVENALAGSGISSGQVTVFTPDGSCVLVVNERESGLMKDIREAMERLQADCSSERKALLGSASVTLPAVDGRLRLGVWQRLLLVELEEARTRKVVVQIVGE